MRRSVSACFQRVRSARHPASSNAGAIGGLADPCSYKLHHLTPEEVTIVKGGEVTFQVHGGGHAMAIYEVSKDTTRDEAGTVPLSRPGPVGDPESSLDHRCRPNVTASGGIGTANAAAEHVIADGHGDVVIVRVAAAGRDANRIRTTVSGTNPAA